MAQRKNVITIEGWVNTNIYAHYNNQMGNFYLYFGKKPNGIFKSIKVMLFNDVFEFSKRIKKGDYVTIYGYLDVVEYNGNTELVVVAQNIELMRTNNG